MSLSRVLLIVALAWVAGAAYFALQSAPVLPLDVSATDPATVEALNAARLRHGLTWGLIALLPALLLVVGGRLLIRKP